MKEEQGKQKENQEKEVERLLSQETEVDLYLTIKRWEALNPHTYRDRILKEIVKESH